MARVALLSCTSSKKTYKCEARELYSDNPRFRLSYAYAKLVADKVYILSAKHGLVAEDTSLEPYNETIMEKDAHDRCMWAELVLEDLKKVSDPKRDEYIIIAGKSYCENLLQHLKKYWLPLEGKALGEWIPELNRLIKLEKTSIKADALHALFNGLPRMDWMMINNIPYQNGIYIMFEKGQSYHGMDRIVRVGTHSGQNRLRARLTDHFIKEDANSSILRKNIGRSFLKMAEDPYLKIWELDTSKEDILRDFAHLIDEQKEAELETRISQYLRSNITFVCIPVETEEERLRLEEGLISTLNKQHFFGPNNNWLGFHSPRSEIRASGLWNRQCQDGHTLSDEEFIRIKWLSGFGNHSAGALAGIKRHGNRKRSHTNTENINLETVKKTADDVLQYIEKFFNKVKLRSERYFDLVLGQIHKEPAIKNRAQVYQIMYERMSLGDKILHATPSGKSSTIRTKFNIK